jgi:hypothetical protein
MNMLAQQIANTSQRWWSWRRGGGGATRISRVRAACTGNAARAGARGALSRSRLDHTDLDPGCHERLDRHLEIGL